MNRSIYQTEVKNLINKKGVKAMLKSLKIIYLTIVLYSITSKYPRNSPYIKAIRKTELKKLEKHGCIRFTSNTVFITETGEYIAKFFLELENGR